MLRLGVCVFFHVGAAGGGKGVVLLLTACVLFSIERCKQDTIGIMEKKIETTI